MQRNTTRRGGGSTARVPRCTRSCAPSPPTRTLAPTRRLCTRSNWRRPRNSSSINCSRHSSGNGYIYIYMYIYMYICICIYTYICIYIYVYIYIYIYIYICVCVCVCVCVFVCVCVCVCMYICVYVYTYHYISISVENINLHSYTYIHTYTHIHIYIYTHIISRSCVPSRPIHTLAPTRHSCTRSNWRRQRSSSNISYFRHSSGKHTNRSHTRTHTHTHTHTHRERERTTLPTPIHTHGKNNTPNPQTITSHKHLATLGVKRDTPRGWIGVHVNIETQPLVHAQQLAPG